MSNHRHVLATATLLMLFAVIGAGPVGCIVAAFLAKGGYEVTVCDVVEELAKATVDPGITVEQRRSKGDLAPGDSPFLLFRQIGRAVGLAAPALDTFTDDPFKIC